VHHTHRLHLYRVADSAHRDKFTALHFAVVNGHIDMLLCLLDVGADCSARDGYAMTLQQLRVGRRVTALLQVWTNAVGIGLSGRLRASRRDTAGQGGL
jgi:ankyrin repeat protein